MFLPPTLVGTIREEGLGVQVFLVNYLQSIIAMESIVAIEDEKNIVGTGDGLDETKENILAPPCEKLWS